MDERELLNHPKIRAMLNVIRTAEGADYNTRVGGGRFSDLSKKPGQKIYIKNINNYSSAEGAYQFLNSTWEGVSKKLGLKDFMPYSQDLAAVHLIKRRGAINDILNDDFESAINKLSLEWASLPTSKGTGAYKGQKARKMEYLKKVYGMPVKENSYQAPQEFQKQEQAYFTDLSIPQYQGITFAEPEDKLLQENFAEEQIQYEEPQIEEFIPQFQDGGTVIKKDAEWLNNWLTNRQIKGQPIPQDFKKANPENVYFGEPEDFVNEENTYGYYDPYYGATILNKDKYLLKPNIVTHELTHQVQDRNPYYKKLIGDPITKLVKPTSYTSKPEEIHSELMRLRQAEGYDPKREVTKEQVDKIKNLQDYNLMDVNKEQLLELLNTTVYNQKDDLPNYAQDGGIIPITPNGMWQYPKQDVIVPTTGHITMEGIDYPIFGTSLETGETKLMQPNKNYFFKNTKHVYEKKK